MSDSQLPSKEKVVTRMGEINAFESPAAANLYLAQGIREIERLQRELAARDKLIHQYQGDKYREIHRAAHEPCARHEDALSRIYQWAEAYPLDVFPEPDFKKAHEVLQAAGMTLDAISASNMRHVITKVKEIADVAMCSAQPPRECPHTADGKHETHDGGPDCRYCDGTAQPPEAGDWYRAEDIDSLVQELDVLLNGEEGAARQAGLCDIVAQVQKQGITTQPPAAAQWIKPEEQLPTDETPVLALFQDGRRRVAELRWEHPGHEEAFKAFRYWDDPDDDGQCWEWHDIVGWRPLPDAPALTKVESR
jgi:hypothetical protein